jgi:hypothetical protein
MQEVKMTNFSFNPEDIISSSLVVKASGSIESEAKNDLELPEGKSIAQLLNDEKNSKK